MRSRRVILRWAADPLQRTIALQSALVDGIDAPGPSDLDRIATLPELTVLTRNGLATAYLGFGTGSGLGKQAVRRALAGSLDRETLADDAFPAGTTVASHVGPCDIEAACGGKDWYGFNAPAASAALAAAGFDLDTVVPLVFPDQPVAGLPDPPGLAAAIRDQLATNLGLHVKLEPRPVGDYQADLAAGKIEGLYLGGVASIDRRPGGVPGPAVREGRQVHARHAHAGCRPRDRRRRQDG